jgi:hypothetical protein
LGLDTCKLIWEKVRVPQLNDLGVLSAQLVDIQVFVSLIEVMESLFGLRQDVVGLEADDIMEEAPEFVDFALHLDIGSGVLLEERLMVADFALQTGKFLIVVLVNAPLLQDFQEFVGAHELFEGRDRLSHFHIELL